MVEAPVATLLDCCGGRIGKGTTRPSYRKNGGRAVICRPDFSARQDFAGKNVILGKPSESRILEAAMIAHNRREKLQTATCCLR
jgi:hypothetical protein